MRYILALFILVTWPLWGRGLARASSLTSPAPSNSSTPLEVGRDGRVSVYKLENFEVRGTTRLEHVQLTDELGLVSGIALDDSFVMTTRSKLLGLGLFRSVTLFMRKGSKPGYARLIIEVEDDDNVLTDWAIGGELSATFTETAASSIESNTAPLDYRLGLVTRNLANRLHRGIFLIDFDNNGKTRMGQIAYGLPRFALEDIQFDAELAAVSVRYRYLDSLGFAGRGQGLWSRSISYYGELQYGAAMYINRPRTEFATPGFPGVVIGPKLAYLRETRLRGFFPGEGNLLGASLLLSPSNPGQSVLEFIAAQSWSIGNLAYLTLDARALTVGSNDHAVRAETRVDIPIGRASPQQDQAEVFLRLRGGFDRARYDSSELKNEGRKQDLSRTELEGSAAILGVRYHSSGFIAELGLKITRSPEELQPKPLDDGATPFSARSSGGYQYGEHL